MLKLVQLDNDNKVALIEELKNRSDENTFNVEETVGKILEEVRISGDKAIVEFNKKFDGVSNEEFEVTAEELNECFIKVNSEFLEALEEAAENIKIYHEKQKTTGFILDKENGVFLGRKVTAIERVGVYVPGGTAAYPSSVLMNVIPAKVAGVKNIIMVTPPDKDGGINPYIGVAAKLAGVDRIFKIGGAQAVAALAYGTESVPKVDKIVGPGNIFVSTAKKLVFGKVDIDMIAGPSEILIIADDTATPAFIAADLMSQAEHDKLASSILVTTSVELYKKVKAELEIQVKKLERKDIIIDSITKFGKCIICKSIKECIDISNDIAPEHLEIVTDNPMELLGEVKNAGSIFLGEYTPEPVGDYFGGTNHVLPTNGTARFFSALSVDNFIKKSSFLYYSKEALMKDGNKIIELAEKEGLTAHANSVKVRL